MVTNLVLGGHSFISQLGTDPVPTEKEAAQIVAACLDEGVVRFDTTYAPERVTLGKVLKTLNRREEAFILAWNFFHHFGPDESIGGHEPYQPEHLETMLEELQTDWIDLLIVHPVDDPSEQVRQQDLATQWLDEGRVKSLGTWMPSRSVSAEPYSAAVGPYNVTTPDAPRWFKEFKEHGWESYATSPFNRGWELDKRQAESGRSKEELSDAMLRYTAFALNVDYVIVLMRKVEWVHANVEGWKRGALEDHSNLR